MKPRALTIEINGRTFRAFDSKNRPTADYSRVTGWVGETIKHKGACLCVPKCRRARK
jgi:hypothetical protein